MEMIELLTVLIIEQDQTLISELTGHFHQFQTHGIEPQLLVVSSLDESLVALSTRKFDIILANLNLSDSVGLDTFLEIQKKAGAIPIIIMQKSSDENLEKEAIKLGAQDFLLNSDLNEGLLLRMIHHAIERNRLHENLKTLSFTDELTGVYNRRGFIALLHQQISLAKRMKKGFYLFIIDLDYFKQINDTYGHLVGDKALADAAKCLRAAFRNHDIIGRIGGDEFAIVAINADSSSGEYLKQHVLDTVQNYNENVKEPYLLSFSIGKAFFDGTQDIRLDELLQLADDALYEDKRLSHNKL